MIPILTDLDVIFRSILSMTDKPCVGDLAQKGIELVRTIQRELERTKKTRKYTNKKTS